MSDEMTPLDAMELSLQHHLSTIPAPAPREHPAEHAAPVDPAARITLDEVCDDAESAESTESTESP